mgnify:CR=1 FL=1
MFTGIGVNITDGAFTAPSVAWSHRDAPLIEGRACFAVASLVNRRKAASFGLCRNLGPVEAYLTFNITVIVICTVGSIGYGYNA